PAGGAPPGAPEAGGTVEFDPMAGGYPVPPMPGQRVPAINGRTIAGDGSDQPGQPGQPGSGNEEEDRA
ncbi:MAG: NADH-quinone oxidoreductase subunit NuoH, partial [Streptomycetales bacterium]